MAYYVDADHGSDANGGTDPGTDAWQTLDKVQNTAIAKGSTIYLRRCDAAYDTDENDGFNYLTGTLPYHAEPTKIIGDNGTYGITEWAVVGDSTTVLVKGTTGGTFLLNFINRGVDSNIYFKGIQFAVTNYDYLFRIKGSGLEFVECIFRGANSWDANRSREYLAYCEESGPSKMIFRGCHIEDFDNAAFRQIYHGERIEFYGCSLVRNKYLWTGNAARADMLIEDSTVQCTVSIVSWNGDFGTKNNNVVFRRCAVSTADDTDLMVKMHNAKDYADGLPYICNDYAWHTEESIYRFNGDEQELVFEDLNGVPGPAMRTGMQWVAIYDSTTADTLRSGGGDSVIKFRTWNLGAHAVNYVSPLADSTHRVLLSKWEFDLPEANGVTEYTATTYCMADGGWGADVIGGTGNKLYLEVDYLSGSDGEGIVTKSRVQSAQDISADDTWTAFSANFTPSRAGKAVARVWVSDYHSTTAFCYLDNFLDVAEA